jgi:hypothetical protein
MQLRLEEIAAEESTTSPDWEPGTRVFARLHPYPPWPAVLFPRSSCRAIDMPRIIETWRKGPPHLLSHVLYYMQLAVQNGTNQCMYIYARALWQSHNYPILQCYMYYNLLDNVRS